MKKAVLLSIALITAGFFTAPAQNSISLNKKNEKQKANSGQDRWEPDTVYVFGSAYAAEGRTARERNIFEYNSQGLLVKSITQYQETDSWNNSGSYTYTYDSNNNLIQQLRRNDSEENVNLYTYTYDSNNNLLNELYQNWADNSWRNNFQIVYTYDSNNNLLNRLHQNWAGNLWQSSSQIVYTYDSNNNLLNELYQTWTNNMWKNGSLIIYTYDSNNNKSTGLTQYWKNDSWRDKFLDTYTYDSRNNRLTSLNQNLVNDLWENILLSTCDYDSNNNLLTELNQNWEDDSWVNFKQYRWIYDENMNSISAESWAWRGESWQPSYIAPQTMISLWLYYNNMRSVSEMWGCDKMTASYVKVSGMKAPGSITDVNPPEAPELSTVSIYPNPTKGELKIENGKLKIQQISVFDISAANLFNTQQTTFDISHLPAGIYFVQIKTEKGTVTRKVVKL